MGFIFILLLIAFFLSAFFASSETAFMSASKIRIKIGIRKNYIAAKSAQFFINNPQNLYFTSLAGSNFAVSSLIFLVILFFSSAISADSFTIFAAASFVVLLASGFLPLIFLNKSADRLIYVISLFLHAAYLVLYPVVKLASAIYSRSVLLRDELLGSLFGKNEIEQLSAEIEESAENQNEVSISNRVFSLTEQRVHECMRPRTEIVGIDIRMSVKEVLSVFIESRFSKLPVFEENLDNIRGIVYAYDFFKLPADLKSIIREVMFIPETKKSSELLNEFLKKRTNFAVVIDEFGGTAGIITMEDIIEELFGEIRDEYDIEEDICRKIDENNYLLSGKLEIDFLNEKYGLNVPTGDYTTVGGYITSYLGRIPIQGENIEIDNFTVLIARADQNKIDVVRLTVKSLNPS